MMNLFEKYKKESRIEDAILVARNLFNQNPGNNSIFKTYFDFLCYLAERPGIAERRFYAEQAGVALAFYAENAEISEEIVEYINAAQEWLDAILLDIEKCDNKAYEEKYNDARQKNESILTGLLKLLDQLRVAKTQNEFDELLVKIKDTETGINEEIFTDMQRNTYDKLTKEYTDIISKKMLELERKKNVEYNRLAVESYSKAFEQFKNDEKKYKNQNQLFDLVSKTLFNYDASRLFNETVIYYNHVYSYIFSKLDDNGKLTLTRYSIDCESNRR